MRFELLFQGKWLVVLAAALMAAMARNAYACATCGLAGDPGYTASVIFMMAVPYSLCLIGGLVAFFAYRNACRRRIAEENYNASQPVPNR